MKIDATTPLYVVTDPTPNSTLPADVVLRVTLRYRDGTVLFEGDVQ